MKQAYLDEVDRYRERTARSSQLFDEGTHVLPGSDSRSTLHYDPHPLYLSDGNGSRVTDVDGHEYVDFTNNHTALVHGNAFAPVLDAVTCQARSGSAFGTPHELQVAAARLLTSRVPSLERVRFCTSGTEATMHATRAARAFTDRPLIAKAEGAYHGSQDDMMMSTHPTPAQAGRDDRPNAVARCSGLGRSALEDTRIIPFNDPQTAVSLLREMGTDLAAVLVEPVMGSAGMIPATSTYVEELRTITTELDALLIFDEVITFRLATGGAQQWFDITPDLTCLGKMIGGGLPLGVIGGSESAMAMFDPRRPDALAHPGSMNAYPLGLAASITTLNELTDPVIAQMNTRGLELRSLLTNVASDNGVPLCVTGLGSLLGLHCTSRQVTNFRDTWTEDRDFAHALFLGLINEGVLIDRRGAACLSSRTGPDEIEAFRHALTVVLSRLTR